MGLAFLMTGPQGDQISDYRGVIGAHSVGVDDGGPGLPLLGWSTIGGDLRIPHFVGMHALQVIPLVIIVIELLSSRIAALRDLTARFRIMVIVVVSYASVLALLTWQALRGQSIVQPDAATLAVAASIAVAAIAAVLVVGRQRSGTGAPA
jgi:cytochrome bd-type quinol oxidase subunit 1